MYFQNAYVDGMIESKFSILDDVRQIETEADFPMSLSIGIGIGREKSCDNRRICHCSFGPGFGPGRGSGGHQKNEQDRVLRRKDADC